MGSTTTIQRREVTCSCINISVLGNRELSCLFRVLVLRLYGSDYTGQKKLVSSVQLTEVLRRSKCCIMGSVFWCDEQCARWSESLEIKGLTIETL